ncbi:MAG TPA: ATP synthase F1 subunit epsilon [Alphaproteobacteria bacterium]|nr:ATP synthase F1 subunit epsilon [Rhodospirillaceae bacterium]HRJ11803.1 ATP synthase F1 subunit epsilon [Alphaproteobacteria bacterium]
MSEFKPNMAKLGGRDVFMYPGGLPFEIISPSEILLSEPVDSAEIPGSEGYFGVMPGHTPLITSLQPGVITLMRGDTVVWQIYVSGGICEVTFDRVTVLAERAFDLPQLDAGEAQADITRLTAELQTTQDEFGADKIRAAIAEAQTRLAAALSQHAPKKDAPKAA